MSRFLYLLPAFFLVGCTNYGQLKVITALPDQLSENSGIAHFGKESVWIIEDSGNKDHIYRVDYKGKIQRELEVKNAKNNDWEDLTTDDQGNLYIGDFGNNDNQRRNLAIYKLTRPDQEPGDKIDAERIEFRYPEQKEFPPQKDQLLYDSEAFFYRNGHFYLFTKNRARPFTGELSIYRIPLEIGSHNATLLGKISTCTERKTCQVTSADISPDGKTIVLLGCGKLWTLTDYTDDRFFEGTLTEIDLEVRTQLESVCFTDDRTLLVSDEVRHKAGGMLYSYSLK